MVRESLLNLCPISNPFCSERLSLRSIHRSKKTCDFIECCFHTAEWEATFKRGLACQVPSTRSLWVRNKSEPNPTIDSDSKSSGPSSRALPPPRCNEDYCNWLTSRVLPRSPGAIVTRSPGQAERVSPARLFERAPKRTNSLPVDFLGAVGLFWPANTRAQSPLSSTVPPIPGLPRRHKMNACVYVSPHINYSSRIITSNVIVTRSPPGFVLQPESCSVRICARILIIQMCMCFPMQKV